MADSAKQVVLKYCEILDEFIRVRAVPEEQAPALLAGAKVDSRNAYHRLVVKLCVPDFESQVLPLFERHNKVYQSEALVELLYQICVEVNGHLDIHSVALPTATTSAGGTGEPGAEEVRLAEEERRTLQQRVAQLEGALSASIVGQAAAVSAVSRAVKKAAVGLKDPRKPVGVFLLVGPTGTGKTELAKALTRHLFDSSTALVRIDCSEYALPHEYAKLIGAPPGYIGHNEGGQLTEAVKQRPACVVLFDEIEKAHEKVHNLLLQLMDEGHLTDSRGERVSFQRAIVLMTSNIGVEDMRRAQERPGFGLRDRGALDDSTAGDALRCAVRKAFRPEFLNRLDEVVRFGALTETDCRAIARLQLAEMAGYLERTGIRLRFTVALEKHLARLGWSPEYGARELRRHIRDEVEHPLTEQLIGGRFQRGDTIAVTVRGKGRVSLSRVRGRPEAVAPREAHRRERGGERGVA